VIEIPSWLESNLLYPLQQALRQGGNWVVQQRLQVWARFRALEPKQRRQVLTMAVILGMVFLYVHVHVPIGLTLISGILSSLLILPFTLIPLGFFALVVLSMVLSQSGADYSEHTTLWFDAKRFGLVQRSLLKKGRSQYGEIANIKEISISTGHLLSRRKRPHICITSRGPTLVMSGTNTYRFGHQLNIAELNWLMKEIQDWRTGTLEISETDP